MNSFSLGNKTRHLEPGQRTCSHISSSTGCHPKYRALNYSVTHRISNSYLYCTANGWLEDQEQLFFYNGIRALEKCWTGCILVAGEYVEK